MVGRVVSTKMQKTVVVLTEGQKEHPLYGKRYLRSKRYLVDDPFGVKDGDIVVFLKVKPISKHKHWQITKVLGQDFVFRNWFNFQKDHNIPIFNTKWIIHQISFAS